MKRRDFVLGSAACITATRAAVAQSDGAIALTVADYGLIFAPIQVNGRAASALVDTGSVRAVQLAERLRQAIALKADERAGTNQRYDGARAVFAGVADEFALGPYRAAAQPVQVVPGVKVGEDDTPALIDTGAPTCNLDLGIIDAPAGALVARSLAFDGRVATAQFRVKDLAPIRRALGCRAVLGHNFLNGRRLRYIRDASTFFLD